MNLRDALETWKTGDPLTYRAVDGRVKGMDRPILSRIQSSITEVTQGMDRKVAGDLTRGVNVTSSDELGQMGTNFNQLLKRFQDLFADLCDASTQAASGATEPDRRAPGPDFRESGSCRGPLQDLILGRVTEPRGTQARPTGVMALEDWTGTWDSILREGNG